MHLIVHMLGEIDKGGVREIRIKGQEGSRESEREGERSRESEGKGEGEIW